jgi:hypothetical protein
VAKRKATQRRPAASKGLDTLTKSFGRWLYLPDPGVLYVALATVVANRLSGDPVWLLFVGGSSTVKTEIINCLGGLEEVTAASDLTKQSLLSGVPKKERESGARGGLLKEIGVFGIVTLKDFGTVLSMRRISERRFLLRSAKSTTALGVGTLARVGARRSVGRASSV